MNAIITRCSNNYGPYQFPEKLIPLFITNALADIPLPVYGDGRQVRDWIHVTDHCRGVDAALRQGRAGQVYNFGGRSERYNIDVTHEVLELTGKPDDLDPPRHRPPGPRPPLRRRLRASPRPSWAGGRLVAFEQGLAETVQWYRTHTRWVDRVRSGAYRGIGG